MLDNMLESTLTSTLHIILNKTFLVTSTALHVEDSHQFHLYPNTFQRMLCILPSQYIVNLEIKDNQKDTEVNYYDILMRTPIRILSKV